MAGKLRIYRGLPGSGKSTRAKRDNPGWWHYESDQYFCDTEGKYDWDMQLLAQAKQFLKNTVDLALARGKRVTVTGVFPSHASYLPLIDLAIYHGAEYEVITCTLNKKTIHNVPMFALAKMREMFEE